MEELKTAVIAIVGRPNVGKSTLFNRLINKRLAITSEIAGTTRDRIYYHTEFNKLPAVLVDTGGLEYGKKENIEADVQTQVQLAIKDADLIIFLFDVKEGLTIEDFEAASALRKSKKKIILVANKSDSQNVDHNLAEAFKLGFGEAIQISAYHNQNVDGLVDEVENYFKKQTGFRMTKSKEELHKIINISFIGKPNVGKSSMVNALLGENKVIVSEIPGTTRDAIDTEITFEGQKFNLIDTAGLRRRGKIEKGLEKISSFRTLDAVERSDIVCLILDYQEGIKKQDQHISSYITEAGKGLILIVNKTDLMDDKQKEEMRLIRILKSKFDFLPWAPLIFVSALRHTNVEKIFELAKNIYEERFKRIPKEELMDFMKETIYKHLPPAHGHIHPKFFSLEQVDTNPPKFVYFVSNPKALHFSYRRYLENELREKYHFTGTAIKIIYKPKFGK